MIGAILEPDNVRCFAVNIHSQQVALLNVNGSRKVPILIIEGATSFDSICLGSCAFVGRDIEKAGAGVGKWPGFIFEIYVKK